MSDSEPFIGCHTQNILTKIRLLELHVQLLLEALEAEEVLCLDEPINNCKEHNFLERVRYE